jgi:uncharacterized membrane protein
VTQSHGSGTSPHGNSVTDRRVTEELAESGKLDVHVMSGSETPISVVEMGVFCFAHNKDYFKFKTPRREHRMKKILVIITAVAITAMAGAAMAADSNTLTVTASVTGTCKFVTGTSNLNFGALDPSVAGVPKV